MHKFYWSTAILCLFLRTCLPAQPVQTLYFIGDAGEFSSQPNPVGLVVRRLIEEDRVPSTVVFLGDNVYPRGVPDRDSKGRERAERILESQVSWVRGTSARSIFIPGNHDWQKGGKYGLDHIINQQRLIDSLNDKRITFLPRDGCPGPEVLPLSDQAILVIIDSQWLLHDWEKPEEESDCEVKSAAELASTLSDIYDRNPGKRVILAAHHPPVSYGEHGGVFTLVDHLFPLTAINPNLYIPIPIVGSIYPLYRHWFGNVQDLAHPLYRSYSQSVRRLMLSHPGSIHAAGHEHALQYMKEGSTRYIVSGSGSKTTRVRKKELAAYAEAVNGFVRLRLLDDSRVAVEFWRADESFPEGLITFQDTLAALAMESTQKVESSAVNYGDSVLVRASDQYQATRWRKKILGENYRQEWYQQVKVPVFDLAAEHGGLKVVEKGGGMQTLSLRLKDRNGREYTLRSVEKYPERAVPEMLRKTFAQDLVQDQISASHPYGALVIPALAEAAGIYHTNPRLVYIPDDPALGNYRKTFANTLALFEERPDGDWSDKAFFGYSDDIINTSKVIHSLQKDNDHKVDAQFVLRSRLFDLLIGDWDRHDDQWRWASYDKGKGELFRPIPRDRDQAFFLNEGFLPRIWSRKWALPKFEGFNDDIRWPSGLSFNARYFDRTFLNGLEMEDWLDAARALQKHLTDSVIETAIGEWPPEIYSLHGDDVVRKLKLRRDNLVKYALSHYKFLARDVDILGSDKHEEFDVVREPGGDVQVDVYKIKKDGERQKKIYSRHFRKFETREIRLYGMDGEDRFRITGEAGSSILVRVIGGGDKDRISDDSHAGGIGRKTIFYDRRKSSEIKSAGELSDRTSNRRGVNKYDRRAFQYDRLAPLIYGNFNPDDGLFIGGGMLYQNHGFRKDPFKQRHIALASIAPRTNSYNFLYRGAFTGLVGPWSAEMNADIKAPNFVNNFFGWGNESVFDKNIADQPAVNARDAIDYYRFRYEEIRLEAFLTRKVGNYVSIRVGPAYQRVEIEEPDGKDRYVYDYAGTLPYDLFTEYNSFAGIKWELTASKRDNPLITRRGVEWKLSGRTLQGIDGDQRFSGLDGFLSFFHTFQLPGRLVFALRAGGGVNTGDYEFYQAQILDGKTELRGYRKTRFYGDAKLYSNLEVRLRLASLRTYLFPVTVGLLGFHDIGRVWYKDVNGVDPSAPTGTSHTWHSSWGGGLWFTPFNLTVLSAEIGHSVEGSLFYLRLGFLF